MTNRKIEDTRTVLEIAADLRAADPGNQVTLRATPNEHVDVATPAFGKAVPIGADGTIALFGRCGRCGREGAACACPPIEVQTTTPAPKTRTVEVGEWICVLHGDVGVGGAHPNCPCFTQPKGDRGVALVTSHEGAGLVLDLDLPPRATWVDDPSVERTPCVICGDPVRMGAMNDDGTNVVPLSSCGHCPEHATALCADRICLARHWLRAHPAELAAYEAAADADVRADIAEAREIEAAMPQVVAEQWTCVLCGAKWNIGAACTCTCGSRLDGAPVARVNVTLTREELLQHVRATGGTFQLDCTCGWTARNLDVDDVLRIASEHRCPEPSKE